MSTINDPNSPELGSRCQTALRVFAGKEFVNWQGLPPGCSLTNVTGVFPLLNSGVGSGNIGRRQRQMEYRMLQVDGYPRPVRAWFDSTQLTMLDAERPKLGELSDLLKSLGEPEARLDFYWDIVEIKKGELVYPARGLTFFTAPGDQQLFRLLAFPVTTLAEYLENFRLEFRVREFADLADDL